MQIEFVAVEERMVGRSVRFGGPRRLSGSSQGKEGEDFSLLPHVCCEHSAGFGGQAGGWAAEVGLAR